MPRRLLIVGASVRAAAFSAIRAGFEPVGIDLFADSDLQAVCRAHQIDPEFYPSGLIPMARTMPPFPWIATGALENHPDVLDRLAANRPFWGIGGDALRTARDPIALAELIQGAGLPCPEARPEANGLPRDGSWLIKPIRSAGGSHVRPFDGNSPEPEPGFEYLQRRVIGPSGSAVFIGSGGSARLMGVTRQWVGRVGAPFGYLGSVGPVRIPSQARTQLLRLGQVLAGTLGLKGVFGVDFVLNDSEAWPVEVNPRYSASVEVLEYATGRSLLRDHARVFDSEIEPQGIGYETCTSGKHARVGKLIVFAPVDVRVPESIEWRVPDPDARQFPRLADLPSPGTTLWAGQPVLTLLERGETARACQIRLSRRLARWRALLQSWSSVEQ